ncbi:MAG: DUF1616 domain-containing protein [Candidatus Hodarchaeales archaeon]|jgi:hypothetical protein
MLSHNINHALFISGLVIWVYSIFDLWSNELILINQNLPLEDQWRYSYLQWRNNIISSTIIPVSIILFFSGIAAMLSPKITPPNLSDYLKTKNARWYWIILILTTTTIVLVHSIPENFYPLVYLRYVFGAIFILWLPGYCFIRALFVNKNLTEITKPLDSVQNIALILSSNLVIVPITGLIINYSPWGIGLTSITFGLLVITILFATFALIREYNGNPHLVNEHHSLSNNEY